MLPIERILSVLRTPVVRQDGTHETAWAFLAWAMAAVTIGYIAACVLWVLEPVK